MTEANQTVQIVEITQKNHDQRLDNFLLTFLKGVPKSRIYKLLRSGQVRVNKGRKKPNYRLQTGDQVRVPPVRVSEKTDTLIPQTVIDKIEQSILFEDEAILALIEHYQTAQDTETDN